MCTVLLPQGVILFVCKCVLYYCHRVLTQMRLNISYHIIYHIIYHISHHIISYIILYIIYHIISYHLISYKITSYHTIYNIKPNHIILYYHITNHITYHIIKLLTRISHVPKFRAQYGESTTMTTTD
jgi:hypothetical protein